MPAPTVARASSGQDPETGLDVTLRDGRFGPYVQLGDGDKPKRQTLPKGLSPDLVDLEKALKLLSLPREVAKHPETGKPILVGIGRFGPYVQHEKTYANLGKDDDVLDIGANRAIDLIITKEQGGGRRGGAADPGRVLGEEPETGKQLSVKAGRYGPYVTDGTTNATLPKTMEKDALTLEEAIALIRAKRASGSGKKTAAKKTAAKKEAGNTTAEKPAKKSAGKAAKKAAAGE